MRIYIHYPLKRVPNGGLYYYNGRFYRKVFLKPSINYCWSIRDDNPRYGVASVLDMFVEYHKES